MFVLRNCKAKLNTEISLNRIILRRMFFLKELASNLRKLRGSVHTSANLIFHFSNKNGNRKYYLSLSYLHILKYRQN